MHAWCRGPRSTVADLVKRQVLVRPRRHRRAIVYLGMVPLITTAPNDRWTADFKGQFRARDGIHCFRLSIADQHTRYLLRVHALRSTKGVGVSPELSCSRVKWKRWAKRSAIQ